MQWRRWLFYGLIVLTSWEYPGKFCVKVWFIGFLLSSTYNAASVSMFDQGPSRNFFLIVCGFSRRGAFVERANPFCIFDLHTSGSPINHYSSLSLNESSVISAFEAPIAKEIRNSDEKWSLQIFSLLTQFMYSHSMWANSNGKCTLLFLQFGTSPSLSSCRYLRLLVRNFSSTRLSNLDKTSTDTIQ